MPIEVRSSTVEDLKQPFLCEVNAIVAAAERQGRDLTDLECEQCEALFDAAEALSRLVRLEAEEAGA